MTVTNHVITETERYMRGGRTGQRYGQAIFNVAYKLYPDATNELRGSDVDPFYNDNNVGPFLTALSGLAQEA